MLLDEDSENDITDIVSAVGMAYLAYLTGRTLLRIAGQQVPNNTPASAQTFTILDQAFIAGKIAQMLGPNKVKRMSAEDLTAFMAESGMVTTAADQAMLRALSKDTERWVLSRIDVWKGLIRSAMSLEDRDWRTVLSSKTFTDNAALTGAREKALDSLDGGLVQILQGLKSDAKRLVQTEMATYFQQGQISSADGEEYVYKVPRASACKYCLDLHLNADGSSKLYKLKDIAGNSNWGQPAYAWKFTVGPVHPHCYCILYFQSSDPTKPSAALSTSLQSLKKSLEENSCGMPNDPNLIFEEQLDKLKVHAHEEHHLEIMVKAMSSFPQQYKSQTPPPLTS